MYAVRVGNAVICCRCIIESTSVNALVQGWVLGVRKEITDRRIGMPCTLLSAHAVCLSDEPVHSDCRRGTYDY
jgi:hypothetical protein